ncbi:MAG: TolC family protein, partial [Bryobacteraceae bacterium]
MLKITIHRHGKEATLELEGKLAGAWVPELETCWAEERQQVAAITVDLRGVSFIDDAGKSLLERMHGQSVSLTGKGCLIRAIISRITGKECESSAFAAGKVTNPKNLAIFLLFFFLGAGALSAQDTQAMPVLRLTLHDAVVTALKQNPQVLTAVLQAGESSEDLKIARAALLPQAQLTASIQAVRANLETSFGQPFPGFPEHLGPFEIFNAGTQFGMPLFDLSLLRRWQAAKQTASAGRSGQQTARERITVLVTSQYLSALRAGAEVRASRSRVDLAQALYDQAADLQKSGAGTGIAALRANVELQNEKQRLLASETAHDVAIFGLVRLLNLDPQQPVALADEMTFFETPAFTVDESLKRAW